MSPIEKLRFCDQALQNLNGTPRIATRLAGSWITAVRQFMLGWLARA